MELLQRGFIQVEGGQGVHFWYQGEEKIAIREKHNGSSLIFYET